MKLILNGEEKKVDDVVTIFDLIRNFNLLDKPIAVELNLKVVSKANFHNTNLKDGDKIEIVNFVGGG